jgi:hypothetical protein
LGKVAGRALQVLYPKSDFATKFRQLKTIDTLRRGEYNADGLAIRITYLPVDRMWNQYADEIRPDILRFIGDAGKVNNQMN